MSRSKARLAADWFAKLRINAQTQEVEHADVATVEAEVVAVSDSVSTTVSSQLTSVASDVTAVADDVTTLSDTVSSKLAASAYTAADVLAKVKTVDGSGSGLDADTLDGQQGSYYQPASTAITTSNIGSQSVNYASSAGNADTLDGLHASAFALSSHGHTGLLKGSDIGGSVDLNSYTADGYYHQNANAQAATGSNYPTALAGMLEVMSDGAMVYQRYTVYNSYHDVYVRTYYNAVWYAWTKQLSTAAQYNSSTGVMQLSNGFMIQWGQNYVGANTNTRAYFITSFPTSCARVFTTINSGGYAAGNKSDYCWANSWDNGGTYLRTGADYAFNVQWLAIGY